jgi:hypothetical protein
VSLWMLISLYGSQVLEMGLFYSRVLKASPLLVKEIKVGEHLLIVYESNAHVPCLFACVLCSELWFGNGSIAGGS